MLTLNGGVVGVLAAICALIQLGQCMDNLRVAFQWKVVDFAYPSVAAREAALASGAFQPENNLPLGLEVYRDRVFVTVPRWKTGVAASLTYIRINDTNQSPQLIPYPNWEAHRLPTVNDSTPEAPEIVSPFRIRADQCGRLWVLDTRTVDILGDTHVFSPTQLLVYDLHNDALIHRYTLPTDQIKAESFFANIAIEDRDCEDTYAYLGDLGQAGLVVYSWKKRTSWRITHNFFHMDPTSGEFNVLGVQFQWQDALFGLALSDHTDDGYSTLYFHPLASTSEFSVSTKVLRDETLAKNSYHEFKHLGSRGPNAQAGASFIHKKTGVLFYALINLNAIACWKTTNPSYTMQSQGRVYMSNETMVFPNDVKVDGNDNLWVLSDRLPQFMHGKLDYNDYNFRILTESVADAVRHTACDAKLIIPVVIPGKTPSSVKPKSNENSGEEVIRSGVFLVGVCYLMSLLVKS